MSAVAPAPDISVGHQLASTFFALVVIVAILAFCVWAARRFQIQDLLAGRRGRPRTTRAVAPRAPRRARAGADAGIRVLERRVVGKGVQLMAVAWRGREMLVGVGSQAVSLLAEDTGDMAMPSAGDGEAEDDTEDSIETLAAALFPAEPVTIGSLLRSRTGRRS